MYPPEEYSDDEWEEVFDNPDASHYCLSPCCYICGYKFTIEVDDLKFDLESARAQRRYKAGLCKAHELEDLDCFRRKAWWTIFRMSELSTEYHIHWSINNWLTLPSPLQPEKSCTSYFRRCTQLVLPGAEQGSSR